MAFLKRLLIFGSLAAALYGLLGFHFIIFEWTTVKILKKSRLTLRNTFVSTKSRSLESLLDIEELRDDGFPELLVDMGLISEERMDRLLEKYE